MGRKLIKLAQVRWYQNVISQENFRSVVNMIKD